MCQTAEDIPHGAEDVELAPRSDDGLVEGVHQLRQEVLHSAIHSADVGKESYQLAVWLGEGRGEGGVKWPQVAGVGPHCVAERVVERDHLLHLGVVELTEKLHGEVRSNGIFHHYSNTQQ